jgi:hypothetical protein
LYSPNYEGQFKRGEKFSELGRFIFHCGGGVTPPGELYNYHTSPNPRPHRDRYIETGFIPLGFATIHASNG